MRETNQKKIAGFALETAIEEMKKKGFSEKEIFNSDATIERAMEIMDDMREEKQDSGSIGRKLNTAILVVFWGCGYFWTGIAMVGFICVVMAAIAISNVIENQDIKRRGR